MWYIPKDTILKKIKREIDYLLYPIRQRTREKECERSLNGHNKDGKMWDKGILTHNWCTKCRKEFLFNPIHQ